MPELLDARREKFAQLVERGWSLEKAYRSAGFTGNRANAWHAQRQRAIAQRIHELAAERARTEKVALARAQKKLDISTERVVGEFARCAFANMLDYVVLDSNGKPYFDMESITRDQGSAIAEMVIDEYKDGRGVNAREVKRVRVKLVPKLEALQALGRHLGLFLDPSVLNLNVANFFSEAPPSMDEWKHEIEATVTEPTQLEASLTRPLTRPGMPRKEKRQKSKR